LKLKAMKNVIKGFAFASAVLFFAACKNDKPTTENASAISAAATPAATTPETMAPSSGVTASTPAATTVTTPKVEDPKVKSVAVSAETPKVAPSTANATPAPPVVAGGKTTSVKFDETSYDWGTVAEGEKMTHIFKFKNTGTNDMIISDAHGSCGCTVPEWPKEPIKPGKSSQIKVIFDSKGKPGDQSKSVTVTANTEPTNMVLMIKGKVTPKEEKK
jgi:hypothetical protein